MPILLCGCASFEEQNNAVVIATTQDLQAGFADNTTKTYVENGKYLRWHEDDRLTAFYGNTLNRQYKFKGQTGDNSGTFSLIPSGELGTGNAFDRIYAVYPYDETAKITDEGEISLTLPAVQNYAENSFGRGANTMIAVTENLEDTFLAFKNACGYLKLKLYNADGVRIKSIEVKGNNGEKIAGVATATIAFGKAPILKMSDNATTAITLVCGEGVTLGTTAETATEFWVVLPETTFTKGITINVTDSEGGVFEKSTDKEVVIERNAVQLMAALGVEFVAPVVKPANNEIWYTNDSTTEATTPYSTDVFGANIVSNTYDAEKGCWVIEFDGKVTTIGDFTFYGCSSLTSVIIPYSITSIEEHAFEGCSSLISITIPDSVTSIGYAAFRYCSSLTSVTIPNSVTSIGGAAFVGCSSLTSITIPNSVTSIGSSAFSGCTGELIVNCNIPSASSLGNSGAFYGSKFAKVTIGDSVTSIGKYAFYGCSNLISITIPDSVTSIGKSAFDGCSSLISITIPDSVTSIENAVFSKCSSLTSITIPDSVTSIGMCAFYYCESLTSVTIPDSVTLISSEAFHGCSSLTSVTIPDSVTSIGNSAFNGCSSLTSVTIPDSVTKIGDGPFCGCSSLTSVTIPDSVPSIGTSAFRYCSSLTSVTIGNRVTSIGNSAFNGCSSLTSVYCKPTTPPAIYYYYDFSDGSSDGSFPFNSGITIYVPRSAYDSYMQYSSSSIDQVTQKNWYKYESYIQPYDFE